MKNYSRYISLWNLENKFVVKPIIAIITVIGLIQGISMAFLYQSTKLVGSLQVIDPITGLASGEKQIWFYRFESLLQQSHIKITFAIGLGLLLLALFMKGFRQQAGANSEITMRRVPLKQGSIVRLHIIHNFSMLALYFIAQFLLIILWNIVYRIVLPDEVQMTNSLFLGFLRWSFLNRVYPLFDDIRLLANLSILVFLAIMIEYMRFMWQRNKVRYLQTIIGLIGIYGIFQTNKMWVLLVLSIYLILVSIFYSHEILVQIEFERGRKGA